MIMAEDIKAEVETTEEIKVLISDTYSTECKQVDNVKERIDSQCDQCVHVAKNPRNLKMHIDAIHKGLVFMCEQCDYSSKYKSNLNGHQKAEHELRLFKCLHCKVNTKFKQYLQKHIKEKHGGDMVYFCSNCDYCNKDKEEYTNHRKTNHSPLKKPRQKRLPNKKSFEVSGLDIFPKQKDNTDNGPVRNSIEGDKTEVYLVEPKLESSLKQFLCESCDYSTDRKHSLTLHNKSVHVRSTDYYCEACPFSTVMKAYLTRHMQVMHKEIASKRNYPLFIPSTELPEHKFFNTFGYRLPRLHIDGYILKMNKFFLNDKEEKCAYFYCVNKDKNKCKVSAKASVVKGGEFEVIIDKKEVSKESADPLLDLLVVTEHSDQQENDDSLVGLTLTSYQGSHTNMCIKCSPEELLSKRIKKHDLKCDLCEHESTSLSELEKHREGKHNKNSYSCDQCDFQDKYKNILRKHIKSKHEGKAYHCTYCDHKATTSSHLRTHVQSKHEGITYGCETCGKTFSQKYHVKIHDDTMHKGITHSCTHCSYVSRQKGHLMHHIKTMHLGQPHKCDICSIVYASNTQLKVHISRDHANGIVQPKFLCDKCNFCTREEIYLKRHMQRKHAIGELEKKNSNVPKRKTKSLFADIPPFSYQRKNKRKSTQNVSSAAEEMYSVEMSEETKPTIEDLTVEETTQEQDLLLLLQNISSPTEKNLPVKLSENRTTVESFSVEEIKKEEELSIDENFIAETKFSVQINKS
eukprot:GFUD01017344.1.p1 GENE.GFUD01017344.1~~GFUD01017344.1.p1  ORF type:complete len:745 (+),score=98.70 GFUD01017344.1:56-2290(+)